MAGVYDTEGLWENDDFNYSADLQHELSDRPRAMDLGGPPDEGDAQRCCLWDEPPEMDLEGPEMPESRLPVFPVAAAPRLGLFPAVAQPTPSVVDASTAALSAACAVAAALAPELAARKRLRSKQPAPLPVPSFGPRRPQLDRKDSVLFECVSARAGTVL